jgi:hypothetical protein
MPAERPSKQPTGVLFVLLLAGVSFALSQTLVVRHRRGAAGADARRRGISLRLI